MSSNPEFHLATKNQLQHIKDGLNKISPQIWSCLGDESINIYVRYNKFAEIYLVPTQMERKLRLIRDLKCIKHTGLYFGFLKGIEFLLSLEGAEFILNTCKKKKNIPIAVITVSEDASKSFLYGNSLKPEQFIHSPNSLNRKDVFFVFNPHNRFIGIGYIYKRQDQTELRNLVDYGYYIRRGF
ncbi:MAG: hypothetical protein JW776_12945 [Candidatus Lokiarchaeota archaeon]|nr:hypothetical protein [Candidatus Lokiarchaeota archaeon]